MKKIAIVIILALPLAACKPGDVAMRVLDAIEDVNDAVQTGIGWANSVADKYCVQVADALARANSVSTTVGAKCNVKNEVNRLASGVSGYCNNPRPSGVADMIAKLKAAARDARAVVAAGC
jgi:hypothetical protein